MNCQVVMESFKAIVNSFDLRLKHTRKAVITFFFNFFGEVILGEVSDVQRDIKWLLIM